MEKRLGVSEELIAMSKAMDKLGVESFESLASLDRGHAGAEQAVRSPTGRSGAHGRAKSFTAFGQAGRKGIRDATKVARRSFSALTETAVQVSDELSRASNRSVSALAGRRGAEGAEGARGAEGKANDTDEENNSPGRQRRKSIGKAEPSLNGLEVSVAFASATPSRPVRRNPVAPDSPSGWTGVGM